MGYELYREVMYSAPADLDTGELALLLILADLANEQTRRCVPGMEELSRLMRMSSDGVMRILKRLEAAGINVRVPVGTDKIGRPVYAHKGISTTYQIPPFGPPKPGPESYLPAAEGRTTVLPSVESPDGSPALDPQSPDQSPANRPESPDHRPGIDPQRPDGSPGKDLQSPDQSPGTAPKPGPPSGPSSSREEESLSSSSSAQRILREAGLGLSDEEQADLIAFANRGQFKGPGWWRTLCANGDLPGFVAAWRAASQPAPASGQPGGSAARRCAACGERFTPGPADPHPCCPPCRNGEPTP